MQNVNTWTNKKEIQLTDQKTETRDRSAVKKKVLNEQT
jgi:hypothetical protein